MAEAYKGPTRLMIGGEWVDGVKGQTIDVLNPFNATKITAIAEATEEDVDRAVAAAKAAFPAWAKMAAHDRGALMLKLADAIEARAEEFIALEALDTGHPVMDARRLDVPRTVLCFRYFGGMADKLRGDVLPVDAGFLNYVKREPIGVVGQIVPWNFPLMFTSWKLGPALAAGNTVVMKPSELTPLSTLRIAELALEVGFPPGVLNVVPGYGHTAGARIANHPDIGKISFTGSTATGRSIVKASAGNLKKLQLELGGKGPNIVFEDANIPMAVGGSAFAIFHNQGQACIAGSRLMLHESIADAFLEKFIGLAKSIQLGDPLSPDTEMGPLTSKMHLDRVLAYCDVAVEQGARSCAGARRLMIRRWPMAILSSRPSSGPSRATGFRARRFWPVRGGDDLQGRRGSAGRGQQHRLRVGFGAVDQQSDPRAPLCRRYPRRHGLDQQLQARAPGFALWRLRRVRLRP